MPPASLASLPRDMWERVLLLTELEDMLAQPATLLLPLLLSQLLGTAAATAAARGGC